MARCRERDQFCRVKLWLRIEGVRVSAMKPRSQAGPGHLDWLAGFCQGDLGQSFDELVDERGDVLGSAAGDDVAVLDDLFVDPFGAGVCEVGVDGGP